MVAITLSVGHLLLELATFSRVGLGVGHSGHVWRDRNTYVEGAKVRAQHPLAVLPLALEQARAGALPGREMAETNDVFRELRALLTQGEKPAPARVLPFPRRGCMTGKKGRDGER